VPGAGNDALTVGQSADTVDPLSIAQARRPRALMADEGERYEVPPGP
jgi:hypothetical protein